VKVELDADNVLHLSTERKAATSDEGEKDGWKYHRMERSSSSVHRAIKLPASADVSGLTAACADGVLTVTIPKVRDATPAGRRRIAIA
jgi:HSP20 family protein